MKPIPETFRQGGFDYRIVRRHGLLALAQKTKPNLPGPMFDVGWIRQLPAKQFPGRLNPPTEAFFRDEDFGKTAWDFAYDRDRAEAAFARMAKERSGGDTPGDSDGGGGTLIPPDDQNQSVRASTDKETAFLPLPTTWVDAGLRFRVLKRTGMVVLVAKSKGGQDYYEVAILQRQDARTWPSGNTTPAKEAMPGDEQWGIYGWSPYDLTSAEAKFNEMVAPAAQSAQQHAIAS